MTCALASRLKFSHTHRPAGLANDAARRLSDVPSGRNGIMRKRYRVLLFAAIVAALIVPVGFALSLDSSAPAQGTSRVAATTPPAVSATIIVRQGDSAPEHMPDAVKLLLVGTTLLGLAAVVRKAI